MGTSPCRGNFLVPAMGFMGRYQGIWVLPEATQLGSVRFVLV